ncbi:MAG: AlpA family phage regulatory protein [Gammaproteobacteria bacterium]|nr:AlpA family phage regulatory protein [Gammaproteobacteria bacterium]MCP5416468.1 AlpA family phage regulatory protein [Chromatiaceae bacterium]
MQQNSILRRREVERVTGLSASTIRRKEISGEFPARIRLGPNSIGWRADEVTQWIDERKRVNSAGGGDG